MKILSPREASLYTASIIIAVGVKVMICRHIKTQEDCIAKFWQKQKAGIGTNTTKISVVDSMLL